VSDQENKNSPEKTGQPESKPSEGGSGAAGDFLIGAVLLVIGIVCIKDGFISPPEDWERWKIIFNQVVSVVGILGGAGMIVRGLLRPRAPESSDEATEEKTEDKTES